MAGNLGKTRPGAGYSGTGTKRQRHRRSAPPPSTHERAEHAGRVPQPGVPRGPRQTHNYPSRAAAERAAAYERTHPVDTPDTGGGFDLADTLKSIAVSPVSAARSGGSSALDYVEGFPERVQEHGTEQIPGLPEHGALGAALTTAQLATGGEAATVPSAAETAAKALRASAKVAEEAGATRAARALAGGRGPIRTAVGKAAAKAEPAIVKGAREGAARRTAAQTTKLPSSVRAGGRLAGQVAAYPVKHPLTAPLAIQTPAFVASGGDPKEYLKALEGKGTLASIAGAGSHIAPIVGEAASLPAAVLPSAYLTGKAGVEAAQGDSTELDALLEQWKETGLLPALAEGDTSKALDALQTHPLYSLLEGSGAASVAGRGAGALARGATRDRIGGLARPDLPIRGTPVNVKRRYSRDLIRQGVQRAYDRTPPGREIRPDTFRGRHFLKEAANRFESGQEAIRKEHIHQDMQALKKTLPKKWGRIDRKSSEIVNLAVERILRHPETFAEDLPKYKDMLETAAKQRRPDGKPLLDRSQLAANKALRKQIDAALKGANPHDVVKSANAFIELQAPVLQEMVDLKLLTEEQAASAAATSFARVHMGAGYEEGIGKVGPEGSPLSLEEIKAEMDRHGVEAPGFLSHRAPANSDFYKPSYGGAMLDKGVRTGESVATGSQIGGTEALVRQLRRSRGLVDRAKGWNKAITRFGIEVKGVETWADARRVLRDPARYGLDPAAQPVAVPRYPFMAKKNEILGALEHQDPSIAGELASTMLNDALGEAFKGKLPDDTPVVFFPGKVAEQLREGAAPSGAGLRGAQAATTLFTRTILPFSVGWYAGNGLDNALRTALAGINPAHFLIGSKVKRELTPEQEAELLAGAHFSSVSALNPHRSVESLVRGYDPLSKGIRQAAEWSQRHGWKQAAAKFAPNLLTHSSNYLISVNKFITEDLPQRGALGKIALAEFKDTQGSWVRALTHQRELAKDFAKKAVDPDKMIQFQKDLETVYGNYSRMSPAARKVLRNISPFWAWFRAAYKFVYVTMPVHHPIQTAALTAAARATQPEREEYGLSKAGEGGYRPVPSFMQGGIPLPNGGIFPLSSYSSFGYASDPLEAANRLVLPQYRSIVEALSGRDWKGEELPGGEGGKVLGALWAFATAFVSGAPLLADEEEGRKKLKPHINIPHPYDQGYVQYKRQPTQQITVPEGGSGNSSSGTDYGSVFSGGGGGSGVDYGAVFGGGK